MGSPFSFLSHSFPVSLPFFPKVTKGIYQLWLYSMVPKMLSFEERLSQIKHKKWDIKIFNYCSDCHYYKVCLFHQGYILQLFLFLLSESSLFLTIFYILVIKYSTKAPSNLISQIRKLYFTFKIIFKIIMISYYSLWSGHWSFHLSFPGFVKG